MTEEKLGPAPILKPPVQVLLEDVQTILRTVERSDTRIARVAGETRERVGRILGAMKQKRLSDQQVFATWKPTSENINALPMPIRSYIHDLETRCDPSGDLNQLALVKDQNQQLQAHVAECERLIKENEAVREHFARECAAITTLLKDRVDQLETYNRINALMEFAKR